MAIEGASSPHASASCVQRAESASRVTYLLSRPLCSSDTSPLIGLLDLLLHYYRHPPLLARRSTGRRSHCI